MHSMNILVPDIGDFKSVEVIELLVKPGDTIEVDQALITVESDKASMEIPAAEAGVVEALLVRIGDKVAQGSPLLTLRGAGQQRPTAAVPEAIASPPAPAPAPSPAVVPTMRVQEPIADTPAHIVSRDVAPGMPNHASPSVRKFARSLGVDLGRVAGKAPRGRTTQEDVQDYVKEIASGALTTGKAAADSGPGLNLLPWPSLEFGKFGQTTLQPLARITKISGQNLHRNWVRIPHVTQFNQADVTELEQFRVASNGTAAKNGDATRLTMLAFVMKVAVSALRQFPVFNASLDEKGENLILKHYYNIGFAADTPHGLVVPVVKEVDRKSIGTIAHEMGQLSGQARDGKLKPADMQGAGFTISSLGSIGGGAFTPIVNATEVAILGISRAAMQPVWDGSAFLPRLMMPLSLSYDHRVIDGATGMRFSVCIADLLGDLRRSLL